MNNEELMHGNHKYLKKVWKNGRWRYYYTQSGGFNQGSANQRYTTVGNNKTGRYVTTTSGTSNSLGKYVGITTGGNKSGSNDYNSINKKVGGLTVSGEHSEKDKYLDISIGYNNSEVQKKIDKGKAFLKKLFG